MQAHEIRIEASYLWHCSPDAAYRWLEQGQVREDESRVGGLSRWGEQQDRKLLEYLLCRRRHPLVDLGLARFGLSEHALRIVHRRGNAAARCAAWRNSGAISLSMFSHGWWGIDDLVRLADSAHIAELTAFASNPGLPEEMIEGLLSRAGLFARLDDYRYTKVLLAICDNPRMARVYDGYMDGWAEYSYSKLFQTAWNLSLILPTEQHWAQIIYRLLSKCPLPHGFKGVDEAIERWRIDAVKQDGDRRHWRGSSLLLRSRLADLKKADASLLDAEDIALRLSFYRRFHPWEFEDWPTFLDRDGEDFADAALENPELWQTAETRERLRQICWAAPDPSHDMMMPNIYRGQEKGWRERKPEWFQNEEDALAASKATEKMELLARESAETRNALSRGLRELTDAISGRTAVPGWAWFLIWVVGRLLLARGIFR